MKRHSFSLWIYSLHYPGHAWQKYILYGTSVHNSAFITHTLIGIKSFGEVEETYDDIWRTWKKHKE